MSRMRWLMPLIAAVAVGYSAFFHQGEAIGNVIWSDAEGYYIYLPALLIHGGFEQAPFVNGCTRYNGPDGVERTFTKYTCGVALLQSPFVFAGHAAAPLLGYERDGRSAPYAWGILFAAVVYMALGLYFLSRWLSTWFGPTTIAAVVLLIFLSTNLFYYTVREAGMSHVYSFFLFALFLFSTQRFRGGHGYWIWPTFLSLALIVLIRPTNAVVALAPFLVGSSISDECHFWWARRWQMFAFIPVLAIVFIPQLIYWKHITGHWLWYSYGNEGFSLWLRPKMLSVLFSPQNGLFLYTPLMAVVAYGMWLHIKEQMPGRWMNPVILLIATYTFGSWWAWWFGGAFGHRCYVEFYALMCLPLGHALVQLSKQKRPTRLVFYFLFFGMIFLNIRLSQIYGGMWDGPDWGWDDYSDKILVALFIR